MPNTRELQIQTSLHSDSAFFRSNDHFGNRGVGGDLEIPDYDEESWFGPRGVPDPRDNPFSRVLGVVSQPKTMENLEKIIR